MASFLNAFAQDRSLENNLELVQQIALRNYLTNGEESKPFYKLITTARVANELYQRVSGARKIDDYKKQCICNIVKYIQDHPNVSKSVLKKEVEKEIALFAIKVSNA